MINYEKYKREIGAISEKGHNIAVDRNTNKVTDCEDLDCDDCLLCTLDVNNTCQANAMKWAASEYVEPVEPEVNWYTVPIDTPVLVSNNKERRRWGRGHFAGVDRYGKPQTFAHGRTSWSNGEYPYEIFNYIKLAEVEYRPLKGANNEDTDEYKKGE